MGSGGVARGARAFTFVHGGQTYAAFGVELPASQPTLPSKSASKAASKATSRSGASGSGRLSRAEREVVALALEGLSNEGIALATGRAISTVSNLLARAARKLGVRRRVELARAIAAGDPGT